MNKKEIIRLAIRYITDEISDEECITVLHLPPEELKIFYTVVNALSLKRN